MPRTDSASRTVRATPDRVFAALLDPEALVRWLPPKGMRGRFERFDARPGGSYRLVLEYDDGAAGAGKTTARTDVVEVRLVDIDPPTCLVQAVDFVSADPAFAGTMTMTWRLSTDGDATQVEIRADGVPSGISAEDHATGLRSSLANLAAHVERGRPPTSTAPQPRPTSPA